MDTSTVQLSPIETTIMKGEIVEAIRTIFDPEIPVNIYELGLIYDIDVSQQADIEVRMTLTSPGCPVAGTLPPDVKAKIETIAGVGDVTVDVVWDPPWNMDMMTEEAKLELGLM